MQKQSDVLAAVDEILARIIDGWFEKISDFYVTADDLGEQNPGEEGTEELKRFHGDRGHRIKFNKDNLDFTYGLRSFSEGGKILIEVSVNNKVENFDYEEFKRRLAEYYLKTGEQLVPTPYELKNHRYNEVFELDSSFRDAFQVEFREGKADIMRLAFRINQSYLDKLLEHPYSSNELVENYCVTPFRTVYATVYRRAGV